MIIPLRPEVEARRASTLERIALVLENYGPRLRVYINRLLCKCPANTVREADEDCVHTVHVRMFTWAGRAAFQEEVRLALQLPPGTAFGLLDVLGLHPKQPYVTSFIPYEKRKAWFAAHFPAQSVSAVKRHSNPSDALALLRMPLPVLAMELRPHYGNALDRQQALLEVELATLLLMVEDMLCPHRGKRPAPLEQEWSEDYIRCSAFKIAKQVVIDIVRRNPPRGTAA